MHQMQLSNTADRLFSVACVWVDGGGTYRREVRACGRHHTKGAMRCRGSKPELRNHKIIHRRAFSSGYSMMRHHGRPSSQSSTSCKNGAFSGRFSAAAGSHRLHGETCQRKKREQDGDVLQQLLISGFRAAVVDIFQFPRIYTLYYS